MLRIAHRGASAYAVENSLAAFKKAVELEVDYIEADVQLTKDLVPVIRHDKLLDRTTNLKGYLNDYTFETLQKEARLSNGEQILHLEELCRFAKAAKTRVYIDFKAFGHELEVIPVIRRHLTADAFIFGAFHAEALLKVKQQYDDVTTVLILEGNLLNLEKEIKDCQCDIVAFCYDSIDPTAVQRVHALNKKVFTWTVDDPRDIQRAKEMGVDGITSNCPDLI
jgi:glycerophosphoryl diester phosphodiesterase